MSKSLRTIFPQMALLLLGLLVFSSYYLPEDGNNGSLLAVSGMQADGTLVSNAHLLNVEKHAETHFASMACALTIERVAIGACKNDLSTGGVPTTLVSVEVEWVDEPMGELIEITFDGVTQQIDPAEAGCPAYALFEVNLNSATSSGNVLAEFSGGTCIATPVAYALPSPCTTADPCGVAGTIGGNVFQDFDSDGNSDASELGLSNILVTVYDCDQTLLCTTQSDQNGDWTCTGLVDGTEVRVEYDGLPMEHFSGQLGTDNTGGAIQFGIVGTDCSLEYGVLPIQDFCEDDPYVITPCYVRGDVLAPGTAGTFDVLVAVPYSAFGTVSENVYLSVGSEIGTTWGIAINKTTRNVFASSFLKRHCGWGPDSLGAIYKVDVSTLPPASPTGNSSLYTNLEVDFGIQTADEYLITRDLVANIDQPS
ncbi:MAG: SdrD B-like domain-containing protein, partial [Bacteroidota bacterium]